MMKYYLKLWNVAGPESFASVMSQNKRMKRLPGRIPADSQISASFMIMLDAITGL